MKICVYKFAFHNSFIYDGQNVEITQKSNSRRLNKWCSVHRVRYYSAKQEWTTNACINTDEPQMLVWVWEAIYCDFIYINRIDKINLRWKKSVLSIKRYECGDWLESCTKDLSGVIEMLYTFMSYGMQMYEMVKTHQTVSSKSMHFMVWKSESLYG